MRILRWALAALFALTLAGCASTPDVETNDESVSLVFGYIDMHDAPSSLDWVSLKKYGPGAKKDGEWYRMGVAEGLFFHIGVESGSYQVDKFGGMGGIPLLTRRPFEYFYGHKGRNQTAIRITKPGIYFLGAHKYVNHAGKGFFDADKFTMEPAAAPTEKVLLQRLIKVLESDAELAAYPRQLELARRRLAEL